MTKTINLESTFTPWTLDTYSVFDLSEQCDYIMENIREDNPDREINEADVDFTFKNNEYLQTLASARLDLLRDNILDNVILAIEADGPATSPREYNFTTDTAWNNWTVDADALDEYIAKNIADYEENKLKSNTEWGFIWRGDEDQTRLNYYLKTESVKKYGEKDSFFEQYYYDMMEAVPGHEYVEWSIDGGSAKPGYAV